jgi:hypothetical protein
LAARQLAGTATQEFDQTKLQGHFSDTLRALGSGGPNGTQGKGDIVEDR